MARVIAGCLEANFVLIGLCSNLSRRFLDRQQLEDEEFIIFLHSKHRSPKSGVSNLLTD